MMMKLMMMNDIIISWCATSQETIFTLMFVALDTLSDELKGRVLSLIERPELRQQCLTALVQVMLDGEMPNPSEETHAKI